MSLINPSQIERLSRLSIDLMAPAYIDALLFSFLFLNTQGEFAFFTFCRFKVGYLGGIFMEVIHKSKMTGISSRYPLSILPNPFVAIVRIEDVKATCTFFFELINCYGLFFFSKIYFTTTQKQHNQTQMHRTTPVRQWMTMILCGPSGQAGTVPLHRAFPSRPRGEL